MGPERMILQFSNWIPGKIEEERSRREARDLSFCKKGYGEKGTFSGNIEVSSQSLNKVHFISSVN